MSETKIINKVSNQDSKFKQIPINRNAIIINNIKSNHTRSRIRVEIIHLCRRTQAISHLSFAPRQQKQRKLKQNHRATNYSKNKIKQRPRLSMKGIQKKYSFLSLSAHMGKWQASQEGDGGRREREKESKKNEEF